MMVMDGEALAIMVGGDIDVRVTFVNEKVSKFIFSTFSLKTRE